MSTRQTKSLGYIVLGITTEIIYALSIILAAFIACLIFYVYGHDMLSLIG